MSASTLVPETDTVQPMTAKSAGACKSASISAYVAATTAPERALTSIRAKVDKGLLRYDAWFLIFTAVILGLGATIYAGLVIWCVVYKDRSFTGSWSFKDFGLKVSAECV